MTRARPAETALAALATILASYPMTTLFEPDTWVGRALLCVLVVAVTGMIARHVLRSSTAVLAVQAVVLTEAIFWLHGHNHLWHGLLPGPDAILAFNNLLYDARITVVQFAAPAPTNRGISLALSIIVAAIALVVDYIAVTRRAPALAGLGLLTAYLITASNSGQPLHWLTFVAPVAAWLLLMGRQALLSVRRWSTVAPLPDPSDQQPSSDVARGFVTTARTLGAVAIVAALALPVVTPHLPTRFLIEGLGRSSTGSGTTGQGEVRLNTTIDLSKSLRDQSSTPVLTYRTTDPRPGPLRVEVISRFVNGIGVPDRVGAPEPQKDFFVQTPTGMRAELITDQTIFTTTVTQNKLAPPQLATPSGVLSGRLGNAAWTVDSNGVVRTTSRIGDYEVKYVDPQPTRSLLEASSPSLADPGVTPADLTLDPTSAERVRTLTAKVVPTGASELEAAVAIQSYLRGPDFTYSLELAGPARDSNGRLVQLDPISHFLNTKQGYCQQFATTMVMMARAEGIPARMALGFLPGTVLNGERVVRASDAHAWPELYFEGVGWLRFEPTPSTRSGLAPAYTDLTSPGNGSASDSTSQPSSSPTTSANPNDRVNPALEAKQNSGEAAPALSWQTVSSMPRSFWVMIALLVVLLGALTVPAAGLLHRRRLRRERGPAERVEVQWQQMIDRIEDLGVSPPMGATPRQAGEYLRREAYLDGDVLVALRKVVTTLELARYAAPGTPLDDITDETGTIIRAVGSSRRRGDRLRAWWFPGDGVAAWATLWERVVSLPGAFRARLRRLLTPGEDRDATSGEH